METRNLFTDHPASVGETYLQHLWTASGFAVRMLFGAMACFIHALLPFAFEKTGSQCIESLHDRMITNRRRIAQVRTGQTHAGASAAQMSQAAHSLSSTHVTQPRASGVGATR